MKAKLILGVLVILIIAGIILHMHSCKTMPAPPVPDTVTTRLTTRVADSIRRLQAGIDSLVIRKKDKVIDSLIPLAAMAKNLLNRQGEKIASTITAFQEAEAAKDTSAALSHCDTLAHQVQRAEKAVLNYEALNDSLQAALLYQTYLQDSLAGLYKRVITTLQQGLDSSTGRSQQLYGENMQLKKDAGKRWSIGPGAGLFYSDKLRAGVTIDIHYDLFKF